METTEDMPRQRVSSHRRRFAAGLVAIPLLVSFTQCEAKPMTAVVDISLFSYLDRPIFDVMLNGKDIGGTLARGFNGANSSMIGETIKLGPQVVTWRLGGPEGMSRNGETVHAKNTPYIKEIPKGVKWIAVHVYDDDTVEITFSKGSGGELSSERGTKIIEAWRAKHAK